MTNREKYGRVYDLVIFVAVVNLASWAFYLLGEMRGKTFAEEACDALRAERLERNMKLLQKQAPRQQGTHTGVYTWER